jgi:hypothetical protein
MRHRPTLLVDREGPILELLRTYRERDDASIDAFVAALKAEVEALESWASSRAKHEQREALAIRQALDFLRTFGHLSTLDFSVVPEEERNKLVLLLALEHRWCYAAAGTTRDAFKIAIGRTGAR